MSISIYLYERGMELVFSCCPSRLENCPICRHDGTIGRPGPRPPDLSLKIFRCKRSGPDAKSFSYVTLQLESWIGGAVD
jgi:hypothetical protein